MIRIACLSLASVVLLGCATYNQHDSAELHSANLPPPVLAKMEHRRPLEPADLVTLHARGISDSLVIRHLRTAGVNCLLTKNDVRRLRAAGLSEEVVEAAMAASDRWADAYPSLGPSRNDESLWEDPADPTRGVFNRRHW